MATYEEASLVIDLIFGLPGQTMENFKEDLDIVTNLPIHGVDLYQLILLENSPLAKLSAHNKVLPLPDAKMRAQMYEFGANYLAKKHKFINLSVSHFGKDTRNAISITA